jgi:ubiquinone/menaquinone biosynthesis C-methylase UbiE
MVDNVSVGSASRQRDYYERTAEHYDAMHIKDDDEHGIALALFAGIARKCGATSILDVGAGTGRALQLLAPEIPGAKLVGIEPVGGLREIGYSKGISPDQLIAGIGEALPFPDNAFDFVIETGALHHVPDPRKVVVEMARVARLGIMISDCNKFGQGPWSVRFIKSLVDRLGLWKLSIWMQTKGKMSKWSEGDGLFYSYSVFDNLDVLSQKFPRKFVTNTSQLSGHNLRYGASQICIIAIRE